MKPEVKNETLQTKAFVFRHRTMKVFCLAAMAGLLFLGCSVSIKERVSGLIAGVNALSEVEDASVSSKERAGKSATTLTTEISSLTPESSAELISYLEQAGLWEDNPKYEVHPILIDTFPGDLGTLDTESKKRVFFHSLLPVVMVALEEIRVEREKFLAIVDKFDRDPIYIYFSENDSSWQKKLSSEEIAHVLAMTRKYRSANAARLLKRIDVVPVSLVLAQGAIESSWGTSRFANDGNNIFGMWTWGEKGIIPKAREEGKKHKIAVYNSILDSVRDYILTINRVAAYESLREMRLQTSDPFLLSQGLLNYSERREEYVNDLQKFMSYNRLGDFDRYSLALL